ncbi:hypothetical protein J1614_000174 [Plenodomus biglobosus]|nr:hypothetical protein J1614_000174 [Plenodomus biglobosus]
MAKVRCTKEERTQMGNKLATPGQAVVVGKGDSGEDAVADTSCGGGKKRRTEREKDVRTRRSGLSKLQERLKEGATDWEVAFWSAPAFTFDLNKRTAELNASCQRSGVA